MNFGKYNKNYHQPPKNFQRNKEDAYQFIANNPYPHSLNKCSSQDNIKIVSTESRITMQRSPNHFSRPDSQPGFTNQPPFKNSHSFQNFNDNFSIPIYKREERKPRKQQSLTRRDDKSRLIQKVKKFEQELQAFDNNFYSNRNYDEEASLFSRQTPNKNVKQQKSKDMVQQLEKEKQQLKKQVSFLSYDLGKMRKKNEDLQKEYSDLQSRFDYLTSTRSNLEESKKSQREQMLASELSLSRRKSEKLKQQYERQISNLKQKIEELETTLSISSKSMALLPCNNNSFASDKSNILYNSNLPGYDGGQSQIQQLQTDLKKKNEMIKYLQMQCRRASQGQQGKGNFQLQNARMTELYEISKKQIMKLERINEILRKENEEIDGKLCQSEKLIKKLKQKLDDRRTPQSNTQKQQKYSINIQKMDIQLKNRIHELQRDREELRQKLTYFIIKDRERQRQETEKSPERTSSSKKLEFRDGKYHEMYTRSQKLRKQSLQQLEKRQQIIQKLKKQEGQLKKRIKQLQQANCQSPTKSNSSAKTENQQKYHQICQGYQKQLQKLKSQYRTLMEMKKKIQSVLAVSQQQYKKLEETSQNSILSLKQEIRNLRKNNAISEQMQKKISFLQKQNDNLKESYFELEQKKEKEKQQKNKIEKQLHQLKQQKEEQKLQYVEKQKKLKKQKDQISQNLLIKENKIMVLEKEREKLREKIEESEKQKLRLTAQPDQEKARIKNQLQKAEQLIFEKEDEIAKLLNKNDSLQKQYRNLDLKVKQLTEREVKLKKQLQENELNLKMVCEKEMKSSLHLAEKQLQNKDIQLQLQQLTNEFNQLKEQFIELQRQNIELVQNKKSATSSILSLQQSCDLEERPNFIEIDKNALLHICDILAIQPIDGQLIKSIIDFLEITRQEWFIVDNYKQILDLFGVDNTINEKTHEILLGEIITFRASLSDIISKMNVLQGKCDNLSKENHRLHKISNKFEANKALVAPLKQIIKDVNQQLIKSRLSILSAKKQIQFGSEDTTEGFTPSFQ